MGRRCNSECGENGIGAGECVREGAPIGERLDNSDARPAWHVGYALRPSTDDCSETNSGRFANVENSLTEAPCSTYHGHMMR